MESKRSAWKGVATVSVIAAALMAATTATA